MKVGDKAILLKDSVGGSYKTDSYGQRKVIPKGSIITVTIIERDKIHQFKSGNYVLYVHEDEIEKINFQNLLKKKLLCLFKRK